jgi:phosphoribosyl-AMP cyclohydrolase
MSAFAERTDKRAVEESLLLAPKFDADGLIPAVATCVKTGDVLMLAYMNAEALQKTIEIGEAVYYSRSRQELWHKGKTSGHVQKVIELRIDCDQDAIWMKVDQLGEGACHTGFSTCFYRAIPTGQVLDEQPYMMEQKLIDKTFDPKKVYGK